MCRWVLAGGRWQWIGMALPMLAVSSGCVYAEVGGGGALPTAPSRSSSEATVGGAMGLAADVRTGPFARGLRIAGGVGTTHGSFALEPGEVAYFTGVWHLRIDQTFWAAAPMYVRWMVAAELGGAAGWDEQPAEPLDPLEGTGWAMLTGPTITIGLEGDEERDHTADGAVHFTLAFHYARFETSHGDVALPGLQLRIAFDANVGGALMEGMRDGMN